MEKKKLLKTKSNQLKKELYHFIGFMLFQINFKVFRLYTYKFRALEKEQTKEDKVALKKIESKISSSTLSEILKELESEH